MADSGPRMSGSEQPLHCPEMRRAAAAVLLAWLGAARLPAERPRGVFGFRVLERTDTARPANAKPGSAGRPVQIAVWYPAVLNPKSSPMTFQDYVLLTATETSFAARSTEATAKVLEGYRGFLLRAGVSAAEADAWLATKMNAFPNAPPAPSRSPLVLIAQGNGDSAADQAFLAENLAALGFVVATTPSQANIDGPMRSEADVTRHVEAQTADLEFALRTLVREPYVAAGRFGVVGHSFGARSAVLFAMRERRVAAVVSLDGGIGSTTGRRELEAAKGFDRARMRAPLLHLYETEDPAMKVDLDLVRSFGGPKWIGRVDAMRHVHFSTAGVLATRLPAVGRATSANADTRLALDHVGQLTGDFLLHYLERRAKSPWPPPTSPRVHWEVEDPR